MSLLFLWVRSEPVPCVNRAQFPRESRWKRRLCALSVACVRARRKELPPSTGNSNPSCRAQRRSRRAGSNTPAIAISLCLLGGFGKVGALAPYDALVVRAN